MSFMNMSMQTQQRLIALDSCPYSSRTYRFETSLTETTLDLQIGVQFWCIIQSAPIRWDMQVHDESIGAFHLHHERVDTLCKFIFTTFTRSVPGSWVRPTEADHFANIIQRYGCAFGIMHNSTVVQRI